MATLASVQKARNSLSKLNKYLRRIDSRFGILYSTCEDCCQHNALDRQNSSQTLYEKSGASSMGCKYYSNDYTLHVQPDLDCFLESGSLLTPLPNVHKIVHPFQKSPIFTASIDDVLGHKWPLFG